MSMCVFDTVIQLEDIVIQLEDILIQLEASSYVISEIVFKN